MLTGLLSNPAVWTPASIAVASIVKIAPWMAYAGIEIGVTQKLGKESNPRVVEYLKTCASSYSDDETDWCGAFVNWCLNQAGIKGAFHAEGAMWWAAWGDKLPKEDPPFGSIGVFRRTFQENGETKTSGHVGFIIGQTGNTKGQEKYLVLGGNQEKAGTAAPCVCVKVESRKWLATRWPPGK